MKKEKQSKEEFFSQYKDDLQAIKLFSFDETGMDLWNNRVSSTMPTSMPCLPEINTCDFIEFYGESKTGKTLWGYDCLYQCILLEKYGGLGSNVVIFDMDNKLSIQNLINIIENNLRRDRSTCTLTTEETYSLVWELLSHITIYHPVDLQQALLILNSLLDSDHSFRLLLIDSLLSYIWELQRDDSPLLSTFRLFLYKVRTVLRKKRASCILISPLIINEYGNKPLKAHSLYHSYITKTIEFHWLKSNQTQNIYQMYSKQNPKAISYYQVNQDGYLELIENVF